MVLCGQSVGEGNLVFGARHQDRLYIGGKQWVVTGRSMGKLDGFLDLAVGTWVHSLCEYVELYTYDLYTSLYFILK